jgi:hydrogenase expression/formation protein HypE
MEKGKILLSHGGGGKLMNNIIKNIFLKNFNNPVLKKLSDSAVLMNFNKNCGIAFTTDSHAVNPIFFPGGDIGKLSVCGTVNDLAVSGAIPAYLSCGIIVEEGFEIAELEKISVSIAKTAKKTNVKVVTGDFKVVEKGKMDGIIINTSGIGIIKNKNLTIGREYIKQGDIVIINGNIGQHELAVLTARNQFDFNSDIKSDCTALNGMISEILEETTGVVFMRDPTRGGLSATLNEIVEGLNFGILVREKEIPVTEKVSSVCELLGFDPLYLANEGKVVIICRKANAEKIIKIMRKNKNGRNAKIIGEIIKSPPGKVLMETLYGSRRIIDMPAGGQFPRIC